MGTTVGLNPSSMVYNSNTGTYQSAGSLYGNVSAAGGFDQSEIDFVTNLINSGQMSIADVAREFGLPESAVASAYAANLPAPESIYDNLDINSVYLAPSETSGDLYPEDDFVNIDESGRDFEAQVFEKGDSDVFQSDQGGSRYYGDTSAPSSAQDMFNQTYAEAMANEKLAADLETQDVPSFVSSEDYFAQMGDTLTSLGLPSTAAEYENINENALLTPDLYPNLDPETIVTDDPETEWEKVDKTKDLASIFEDALDIFGAYDRNSIRKVVDIVNDRGVSAQEVATITGNTVESINQAAAQSDTAINNQGTAGDGAGDTGTGDTGDVFNEATDPLNTGAVLTNGGAVTNNDTVINNGELENDDDGLDDTVVDDTVVDDTVITDDTPVIPVLDTPVIAEDPNVIVNDTPILPTIMQPTPKPTTNISLFQSIQNTPVTDSLFFEPKFTELDNIPVGMFERFLQATGGR